MEIWFLLAVCVALSWGLSGIFAKYSTPRLGVGNIALLIIVVEGVMYAAAFLVLRDRSIPISIADAALATASCLVGLSGYLCYFESILEGQVAIAGTISAGYPALTVVGAVIILGEEMSFVQAIGVAAIILGVIAISYEPDRTAVNALSRRSLLFASLAFFAWAFWSLSSKAAIDRVGAGNIFGFYVISSLTIPPVYAWLKRSRPAASGNGTLTSKAWVFGGAALALNVIGAFAFSYGLEEGTASLVVPISSAYPIVTGLLAVALLREKLNWIQAAALVTVVAGLVVIGLVV